MSYRLNCPHCNGSIAVSAAKAGSQTACEHCGRTVTVPKLGQLRQLPPMDQAASGSSPEKNSPERGSDADSPLPIIALGLLATAAMLVGGYAAIRYVLSPVDLTTDQHLAQYDEAYRTEPVAVLIREYENIEQYGLELPLPAAYIKQAEIKRQWGTTAIAAAVVGIASAGGLTYLSRRRR